MSQTTSLWSSRLAFILATTGAAVGLGNIWKFPYIAGEHGGGLFVIVYLICVALLGIPIMLAEVSLGKIGRGNPMAAIDALCQQQSLNRRWRYIGLLGIGTGFLILSYYSVIAGWTLHYLYQSITTGWTGMSPIQIEQQFQWLLSDASRMGLYHSVVLGITTLVLAFELNQGLERAIYILFPVMLCLLLLLVYWATQSGYFLKGLYFLFHPKWHALSTDGFLMALGHAFFTLSLGMGSVMMYGAYVPDHISLTRSVAIIALGDTLIALLAGLAIFPIVFAHDLSPNAGPGLIFKTLPLAFGHIEHGTWLASAFFMMLLLAAITSTISLLEPTVAWMHGSWRWSRVKASICAGGLAWVLGFVTIWSFNHWQHIQWFGMNLFDALDYLTANLCLPLSGLLIAWFTAHVLRPAALQPHLNWSSRRWWWWRFCLGTIAPTAITLILLNEL